MIKYNPKINSDNKKKWREYVTPNSSSHFPFYFHIFKNLNLKGDISIGDCGFSPCICMSLSANMWTLTVKIKLGYMYIFFTNY
jgi:hypothetical protein